MYVNSPRSTASVEGGVRRSDNPAARLEKGALPLEQALALATEVAEPLSAAHRQGAVRREDTTDQSPPRR
jgi:hypothetical protein